MRIPAFVIAIAAAVGLTIGLAGASRLASTTQRQTARKQASYVRVCRDARGVLDRRACRANDPKRTQLALNLAE